MHLGVALEFYLQIPWFYFGQFLHNVFIYKGAVKNYYVTIKKGRRIMYG